MNEPTKEEIDFQCPPNFILVQTHQRGSTVVNEYCRKAKITRKKLGKDTIAAIPFGWDIEVGYEYLKYGKQEDRDRKKVKKNGNDKRRM